MANTVTKSNGDVLLANTMPQAEYMYGCTATSMGMLLGYYDLYGYNGTKFGNLITGTVALKSRGTDGNAYDMDAFDTVLGKAIASEGYVERFYGTTPEEELPYTYKGDTTELNTAEWDCIADYLGTGQYWRGNGDKSTTESYGTLEHLYKVTQTGTITSGSITRTIPFRNTSMIYGLDLYVQERGYSLDAGKTGTFKVDVNGGTFTFEDYMAEIDAGRPVIVSIVGHAMIGYGYNASTREIIFDDCYKADQRMTWDGLYDYSGQKRSLESITTIVFNVSGGGGGTTDTTKPTVSNVKASTTASTNQDVKVTAVFDDDVSLKSSLYRIGDSGSWKSYPSGGVTVSQNGTVYFKAVDSAGNESTVVSYKVTNIDKTAPTKPTASADVTSSTTNPVYVTAKFSDDSSKKEYSLDNKTWKTYSGSIKFTSNGTVYFRGTDAAGNVSAVTSYKVSNIKNSTPDPDPGYDTSGCDDSKNDWVVAKDKSGTTLRNPDSNFATSTVTKAGEIKLDTKSISNGGKHNFVGYDDEADFAKINLNSAAKLSFTATATGASKLAVYSVTTSFDKKGNAVYSKKQINSVTLKQGKGESEYTGSLDGLLLDPNSGADYYVAMESPGAKKGAYYNVTVDSDSVFFTRGNNVDDWLYDKETNKRNTSVGSIGTLTKMQDAALVDEWVGYGDAVDYKKFSLTGAAKICLEVDALAPVKISICKFEVKTDKKGQTTTSLKTLVSATTTTKFSDGVWCVVANPVLLEKGDYYIRVESTTAKKGASATYSLYLANYSKKRETKFYPQSQSNNNDDWVYDKETNKLNNNFASYTISNATILLGDWVGFGDAVDYRKFEVKTNAKVSFCITCAGPTKFTVYRLVTKTDKKGSTTYSLKTLQSTSFKAGSDKKATKLLSLAKGETYYFSMASTNAKSGGESHYDVDVAQYVSLPAGGKNSGALAMPEGIGSAQDVLSFGQYDGGADVLAGASSAASGFDFNTDDGSAWQDVAKLA